MVAVAVTVLCVWAASVNRPLNASASVKTALARNIGWRG